MKTKYWLFVVCLLMVMAPALKAQEIATPTTVSGMNFLQISGGINTNVDADVDNNGINPSFQIRVLPLRVASFNNDGARIQSVFILEPTIGFEKFKNGQYPNIGVSLIQSIPNTGEMDQFQIPITVVIGKLEMGGDELKKEIKGATFAIEFSPTVNFHTEYVSVGFSAGPKIFLGSYGGYLWKAQIVLGFHKKN